MQNAGDGSARLRRDRLRRQRTAEAPFAAHCDAEQRAQDKEDGEIQGKRRERADDRIAGDVEHQRRPASPSVADAAEDEGANEPHRQRQKQSVGDRRHTDAELLGDVAAVEAKKLRIHAQLNLRVSARPPSLSNAWT